MNYTIDSPTSVRSNLDAEISGPAKVQVCLLDQDHLPLASGTATLPLLLGMGIFWPSCPMPAASRLAAAKCFVLPSGETMNLKSMKLGVGNPPRYDFWVSRPVFAQSTLSATNR